MGPYIRRMNLQRGKEGLGFILTGENPCVISSVNQNSPAIQAGLKTGDEILEVNAVDVSRFSHADVVKHILKYNSIYIELKVRTFSSPTRKEAPISYPNYSCGYDSLNFIGKEHSCNNKNEMSLKKEKVKGYSIENKYCSCNDRVYSVVNENRHAKEINGDIHKLSNRRAYRFESYPEKRKNSRPSSFIASCDAVDLCKTHKGRENSTEKSIGYHVTRNCCNFEPLPKNLKTEHFKMTPEKKYKTEEFKFRQSFIVFYQCTIDIPEVENIREASIKTLSSCVNKIQNDTLDSGSIILLSICSKGIKLTNPIGNNIVMYPVNSVIFNCICSEDRRYFGLVTRKVLTDHSADMSSSFQNSPRVSRAKEVVLCSCHVFMVNPNLANHDNHYETANLFGISCNKVVAGCQQFPDSPSVILLELNTLFKKRESVSCYSLSSLASADFSTPDKTVISNTLERIRSNAMSSTPRDPRKLMVSPPTSLLCLDDEEKKAILRDLENQKGSQSEDEGSNTSDYFQVNNDTFSRRKSATESELFGNLKSNEKSTIKAFISSNLTQSLRNECRKPPAPQRMFSVPKNLSDVTTTPFFNGVRKSPRRKSEATTFSPKASLKELFFKGNVRKRKDTPPSNARFYLKRDANENLRQLSLSSAASEQSLDEKVSRVEGWSHSFEKLLSDAVGLRCFQEFLKMEFSEENLLFWVSCEQFKRIIDLGKMKSMANEICRKYLSTNAPFLVNVDSNAVKKTELELNLPHVDMFNEPQEQVFKLMKFDSYNRFLKSKLFQECVLAENDDRLFPFEEEMDEELRRNPLWTNSMKSPISESTEKRKNPKKILNRNKLAKSPEKEKLRKERSSSLGAYDECNRKNVIYPAEMNGHTPRENQLWDGAQAKSKILRVVLPDGSSGVIVGERGQTLQQGLKELSEQKGFSMQSLDVTVGYEKKIVNIDTDISLVPDNIIYLTRTVLLRFDLPNGRSVGVKSTPDKSIRDVLQPVMKSNGFDIENYSIFLINSKIALSLESCMSTVENKRLITKLNHRKIEKINSDSAVSRIGAQAFRASFRKFRANSNSNIEGKDEKLDGRKLNRKKSDDGASALMSVLQKSQSGRLDDQRGMISHDIEMPEFLRITSSTPSPLRSNAVNSGHSKVLHGNPIKQIHQHPGSTFIVDKNLKDLTEKLDLSLSAPLNNRMVPDFCSFRSWKELPSPDRKLIDRSYTFDASSNVDGIRSSADSVSTSSPVDNRTLTKVDLSKSDSSLRNSDSLINVSNNSLELYCSSSNNSQKCIPSQLPQPFDNRHVEDLVVDDTFIVRSMSCDSNFKSRNLQEKNNIRSNTMPHGRPLPINKFNESDVLRGLDSSGYISSTPNTSKLKKTLKKTESNPKGKTDASLNIDDSPAIDNSIDSISKKTVLSTTTSTPCPVQNGEALTLPKVRSSERIGSVDIVDYNLSPRAFERYRKISLSDDMLLQKSDGKEQRFESNAIPTPSKEKLLKGETIRGRQNEKISFV